MKKNIFTRDDDDDYDVKLSFKINYVTIKNEISRQQSISMNKIHT